LDQPLPLAHPVRTGAEGEDQASGPAEAQLQPAPKELAADGPGQVRGEMMKVKDVPPGRLLLVEPQTTVAEVARLMRVDDCDAVAVMTKGRLVGIVTEKDLVQAIADGVNPQQAKAEVIMSADPATVDADEDV